jgi:protein required for attachment to host cells
MKSSNCSVAPAIGQSPNPERNYPVLVPHGVLILVVDGSRMQLLRNRGKDNAPELEIIADKTQTDPPTRALASDGPGRSFESAGSTRHGYATTDYHQQREDRFGKKALALLQSDSNKDAPIILIAPPHMLGELRSARDAHIERRIIAEIDKDLTHLQAQEIAAFLHKHQI